MPDPLVCLGEGANGEGGGEVDEICDETEVKDLHYEVVVSEEGVEGLCGGVAQCEVQVHL